MKTVLKPMILTLAAAWIGASASAQITDLTHWDIVRDPPELLFDASATPDAATLTAGNGPIDAGTDIGYASVDGPTVAGSSSGFYFDNDANFALAITFDLSFLSSPTGTLGLGFGIGEDRDGENSAGVGMLNSNGSPVGGTVLANFLGAARINNQTQLPIIVDLFSSASGTLFVSYEASSGDVTVGASTMKDAAVAAASNTFPMIQNSWSDQDLLASFFIRSEDGSPIGGLSPWSGGEATAVFSNLRVLDGTPIAVPEPTTAMLLVAAGAGLLGRRRG